VNQVNSGIHHFAVGETIVTALHDGVFQAETAYVDGLPGELVERLLRAGFRSVPPRITVSCFLLGRGGSCVLIDAGSGSALGPGHGLARERLHSLGVAPDEIGTILLTHAHLDHVGGLIDQAGRAAFPNAELVLHEAETAFWLADDTAENAAVRAALGPYRKRLRTVRDGEQALPGVVARHLPGHTPGHCGWMITDSGASLLIWGDVVHLPGIQFSHPEASLRFDRDIGQSRATRRRLFEEAATEGFGVAGPHLDFPTFGHLVRAGDAYVFQPEVWRPAAG
jgi:glyoxylase-like metal-dependent hydrolase (beta-lactamase superfamily II)